MVPRHKRGRFVVCRIEHPVRQEMPSRKLEQEASRAACPPARVIDTSAKREAAALTCREAVVHEPNRDAVSAKTADDAQRDIVAADDQRSWVAGSRPSPWGQCKPRSQSSDQPDSRCAVPLDAATWRVIARAA